MKKVSLVLLVALFFSMLLSGAVEANVIEIRGSDTQVNLVGNFAEAYMDKNPEVMISVTGGGSGTGISGLINSSIDLANVSRLISEDELDQAHDRGVEPSRVIIALDALSVITHPDNPVEELTLAEIGDIFRGDITNWADVGGKDQEINLYGRQSNSGTYVYFRENVVKADFSDDKMRMNGNAQIVEGVKSDSSAIGYVGVGYTVTEGEVVEGLNLISVALEEGKPFVTPLDPDNVAAGLYPLARPLHHYSDGTPQGVLAEYIDFVLSEEGQQIAVDSGFYPITEEFEEINRENLGQ